jgi:GAF domain-containing protein/anti-sigma regulatory factor (Ser/Thr protein kinase)
MTSSLIVPLRTRGRMLGALTLVWGQSQRLYDHEDLAFAEELGRRVAVAVDNARLHRAEQEARAFAEAANERLHHLERIAEIGLESRSLDELLERLLVYIRDLLEGDRATMLLLDQDRNELRVRAAVGLAPEVIEQVHVPFGKGIAGTIASTGRPRVIGDLTKANPISAYLRHSGGSLVGVPLRVDDRVLGVLHVTTDRKHAFSELDLGFLELVGERAALALERTAAYEHEHATALTLQRSVLPRRLPDLERVDLAARYLPGSHGLVVGGDWYDAFELRGGRIGVVVGDVVGKGVEAAAAMAQIRNALRVYALDGLKPSTIVTRLRELPVETFATVVIASVDPGRSICRYANAGHPPPLLLRVDGSATYLEGGRSTPLGADFDVRSAESSVDLAEGDTLLLYTDGLVESRARSLADGLALLEQSIRGAPRELEALLDHVVDRMLDPDALPDDVALLAFRLQPTVKKLLSLRHRNTGSELTSIRRRLASWLEALGIAPRVVGDIVLAANELCANAIEHAIAPAQAAIEVAGELEGRTVTVEVRDFGTWREPVERDDRGFGLPLVTALMDELEITPGPDGTRSRARKRVALAR